MFELKRVHSGFPLEVIISNHVSYLCALGDAFDLFLPSRNFALRIKIVVAIVAIVAIEPLVVVSAVQTNVAKSGCHVLGWLERTADLWLINIAEGHVLAREVVQSFGIVPALVPHFHGPRKLDELP